MAQSIGAEPLPEKLLTLATGYKKLKTTLMLDISYAMKCHELYRISCVTDITNKYHFDSTNLQCVYAYRQDVKGEVSDLQSQADERREAGISRDCEKHSD